MKDIIDIVNSYSVYIFIAMAIIIVLLFVLVISLFKSIGNLEEKYRKLMRGTSNTNLEQSIVDYLDKVDESNKNSKEALEKSIMVDEKLKKSIQKVSVIRYKAFENVGSDLSFSIAMLDESNDGLILTGIYGRNESTTYAKPIDKGISRYDLSEEENTALNKAINQI